MATLEHDNEKDNQNQETLEEPIQFGQLDLFGGIDETPVPNAKKNTSSPKPPKKSETKPKKPVEEKVDTSWNVAYAGQLIPVPEDDMSITKLHQFLEVDFPELSKSRSTCALDKEGKIITFAPNGAKKG